MHVVKQSLSSPLSGNIKSSILSCSDMQASETPPMPTSDGKNTGPALSDDDGLASSERFAYLELYNRGQELLDQHMAQH